jgi:probable O-glycosylation ligase (exosortase A-associated)
VALRELALIFIVLALCIGGLIRPKIALYGYLWFAITEPDVMAFCEAKYPFSMALGVLTVLGGLRKWENWGAAFRQPAVWGLLLLQIPIGLSILFCEGPFLAPDRYNSYLRTMLVALLIPVIIESGRDMVHLLLTLAVSEGLFGSRFGLFGLMGGGVLLRTGYSTLYDNNEVAVVIVMLLPACWYLREMVTQRWLKVGLLVIMVTAAPAVIMTNSRGGSLALAVVILCLILRSRRRIMLLIVLTLAIGPAIYLMQDVYFNRMNTINHYEDEASAAGRIDLWNAALKGFQDHPILGFGFGQRNFQQFSPGYLGKNDRSVVHETYLQMLVDSGIGALALYASLLFGSIIWLGHSARRTRRDYPGWQWVPIGLQVPLLAFSIGALFYSCQRLDLPYFYMMSAAAWRKVSQSGAIEEVSDEITPDIPEDSEMLQSA